MHAATLFEKKGNKLVRCTACAMYCTIADGLTGVCGVRQNKNGELFLLVYGKASAVQIDPIEKKPLFHFLPNTEIFSLGTVGCNFACSFCQNWDLSQATRQVKEEFAKDRGEQALRIGKLTGLGQSLEPEKIVDYCIQNSIPGIAFTYNEPSIVFEYAFDTFRLAKKRGLKTVFVSNGYESLEATKKLEKCMDAINIDLKAFTDEFYLKTCRAKLEPVLESIRRFAKTNVWLEITTLVIPGKNDSEGELREIAEFIAGQAKHIPWHVTAFHPDYKMRDSDSTPKETLAKAYKIGKEAGLKFVYAGNILDEKMESTFCPKCNALLIRRQAYAVGIENIDLKKGKCKNCANKIEGVWK